MTGAMRAALFYYNQSWLTSRNLLPNDQEAVEATGWIDPVPPSIFPGEPRGPKS